MAKRKPPVVIAYCRTWDCCCPGGPSPEEFDWQSLGAGGGGYYQTLATAPGNPNRVYAGIDVGGIYRSDDGGLSWREIYGSLRHQTQLAQNPIRLAVSWQNPDVFYMLTLSAGIWKSVNGGASYTRVGNLTDTFGYGSGHLISVSPVNHDHVTFFAAGQFLTTIDGGGNLSTIAPPVSLAAPVASAAFTSPAGDVLTLWVGSGMDGILGRWSSQTGSWVACGMNGFPSGGLMMSESPGTGRPLWVAKDFTTGQPVLLMLALADGRAYRSADLGENWAQVPNSPSLQGGSLWVDEQDARRMAVNIHPGLGFMTADNGATGWVPTIAASVQSRRAEQVGTDGPEMHAYEFVPGNPSMVFGREGYSLYRSMDGGHTFAVVSQTRLGVQHYESTGSEATFANWMDLDPAGSLWHSDQDCGLARSDDGGQTWHTLRYAVSEGPGSDHPAGTGSIWNTDSVAGLVFDQGFTYAWITGRTVMPSDVESFNQIWNADTQDPLTDRHSIYRSSNGELFQFYCPYAGFPFHWNSLANNLQMDPTSSPSARVMYLCVPSGIWKSTNTGLSWSNITPNIQGGLPVYTSRANWDLQNSLFASVRLDPTNYQRVYVSTIRRTGRSGSFLSALYKSENGGSSFAPITSPVQSCWAMEVGPTGTLWAADRNSGLQKSTNQGASWTASGLATQMITSIAPSFSDPTICYAAAESMYEDNPTWAGVYKISGTAVQGIVGNLPHLRIMFLNEDPITPGKLYLGSRGGGSFTLTLP